MTESKPADKPESYDFEQALATLESLVERMEKGELSLEESLHCFEEGVQLTRECQRMLKAAELRVEKLAQTETGLESSPLDIPPEND